MVKLSLVLMSVLPFIVAIVEDVSLFPFTSPTTPTEEEGNKDQNEGFTGRTNPLSTDNLNQAADKISRREKRAPKFKPGPNGDPCILSDTSADFTYHFTDPSTGRLCECDLCKRGEIFKRDCTCNQDSQENQHTDCDLVRTGQIMQARNKCKLAYNCTVCNYPWIVDEHDGYEECNPAGPDITCTCGPDGYLVTRNDCRPVPRCSKDHEPISGGGEHGTEMRCSPCEEGYHQPESNTTNKCRRIDPEERGTATLDVTDKGSDVPGEGTAEMSTLQPVSSATQSLATNVTLTANKMSTTVGVQDFNTELPDENVTTTTTGEQAKHCMTWEAVLVGVAALAIGVGLGGAAVYIYIKKPYHLEPLVSEEGTLGTKNVESSMELGNFRGGTDEEPNEACHLNPSPDSKVVRNHHGSSFPAMQQHH